MYLDHFGFLKPPFATSPDPEFFYYTAEHRVAMQKARYAVAQKLGLCMIIGEYGTGKTTITHALYDQWKEEGYTVALLLDTTLPTHNQFLRAILKQYRQPTTKSTLGLLENLQNFLASEFEHDHTVVLMIDEAQSLPGKNLEMLRQLLNYETRKEKLLQIVLFGQMEMRYKLAQKPALQSRIALVGTLDPLSFEDTVKMVHFRMSRAGVEDRLFSEEALHQIYQLSRGIPRDICIICDNALLNALLLNKDQVDSLVVEKTAKELEHRWQKTKTFLRAGSG